MEFPDIQGIDTRALTRRLRNSGAMRACIAVEGVSDDEAIRLARVRSLRGSGFCQGGDHGLTLRLGCRESQKQKVDAGAK